MLSVRKRSERTADLATTNKCYFFASHAIKSFFLERCFAFRSKLHRQVARLSDRRKRAQASQGKRHGVTRLHLAARLQTQGQARGKVALDGRGDWGRLAFAQGAGGHQAQAGFLEQLAPEHLY